MGADVTDTTTQSRYVDFRGRRVEVKPPTDGQLMVISRFARRFAAGPDGSAPNFATADQAVNALSRVFDIIAAVIVHPADADWVEDLVMSGTVDIVDTLDLLRRAVDILAGGAGSEPAATLVTDGT